MKFDISSENFDLFFLATVSEMTAEVKESIPTDFLLKLFSRHGSVNPDKIAKLNFLARLYYLWKMKSRFYLVIEGENGGIRHEDFVQMREHIKHRDFGMDRAKEMEFDFVVGGKEFMETLEHLNKVSASPAYNFLMKKKAQGKWKLKLNKTTERVDQMTAIVQFISNWEGHKKKWVEATGVTVPEFLVLIYCYHGRDVVGSEIYKGVFKRAYQSSPNAIKKSFCILQTKGFLKRTGIKAGAKMSITPMGKEMVNSIINKYALKQ